MATNAQFTQLSWLNRNDCLIREADGESELTFNQSGLTQRLTEEFKKSETILNFNFDPTQKHQNSHCFRRVTRSSSLKSFLNNPTPFVLFI